ncbi:MAG TPA: M2 family metallopeptidase [Actinomycetota bacterium]|nr:M2 family metallopeptidase [Actinomycetota bacterium]
MTTAPHKLVTRLEDQHRELEIDFLKAYWDSQIQAGPETETRRAAAELELRRAKGDPAAYQEVLEALDQPLHDPVLRRQLEVLRLSMTEDQMDEALRSQIVELSTAVEGEFASYRPEVDGKRLSDNEIDNLLKTSADEPLRRAAWNASKEIGGVVGGRVRELARLRNKAAHDRGFADYYRMALELEELSEEWLFGLLDEVAAFTEEPFTRFKRELDDKLARRFGVETVYPWHYADPFFQSMPPDGGVTIDHLVADASPPDLAARTFSGLGIDLDAILDASDLYPRENKSQHAFCISIDRGSDVRILANVVPDERWTTTMLHECGHAAYDISISQDLPFLLRTPAHIFTTEAMAILSGRWARNSEWLLRILGADQAEIGELTQQLQKVEATESLLFARWVLVMTHFERELYSDPESDLDRLWWELVAQFQLVNPPPDPRGSDWAAKIHIASAPVYYHNYLLGEILAKQIEDKLQRDAGGMIDSTAAGDLLKDRFFAPGNLMRWDALIEASLGSELSVKPFAEWVGGRL